MFFSQHVNVFEVWRKFYLVHLATTKHLPLLFVGLGVVFKRGGQMMCSPRIRKQPTLCMMQAFIRNIRFCKRKMG